MTFVAKHKDGRTQSFTQDTWDLLPKDKYGWVRTPSEAEDGATAPAGNDGKGKVKGGKKGDEPIEGATAPAGNDDPLANTNAPA